MHGTAGFLLGESLAYALQSDRPSAARQQQATAHDSSRRFSSCGASTSGRAPVAPPSYPSARPNWLSPSPRLCRTPCTASDVARPVAAQPLPQYDAKRNRSRSAQKTYDLVTFSNLCVDVVVPVEDLPPPDRFSRSALLEELTAQPPPIESWEVGGNTNTLIAASRLGLKVACIGHVGDDAYGRFLIDVLDKEGIQRIEPVALKDSLTVPDQDRTLICFVLVAPDSAHAFCSRYDFGPWPLLSFVDDLSHGVKEVLQSTASLFINGFVFDELPASVVLSAAAEAQRTGAAVLFDPGPRAWTFNEGSRRQILEAMLDISDVVLMTADEALAVMNVDGLSGSDADEAARWVLNRPGARTEWCIIKRGEDGALLASRSGDQMYEQRALKVDVRDTVGCGDSFAAAVALGFSRQHNIPAVMALASAVGAATAMGTGGGRNVARAEDVAALLATAVPDCEDGRHAMALRVLNESIEAAT